MSRTDQPGHNELREGDLFAYLDGAAPPALAAHIAGCPRCQAELRELRAAESMLDTALFRADCPAPELLLRFQAGLLARPEALLVAEHAAACADCSAELTVLTSPPNPTLPERLVQTGRQLVRVLLQPALAPTLALRGGELAPRRMVYAADGYQIVLVIAPLRPAGGRYQIEGQLLTPGGAQAGAARLSGSAQEERAAEVDELGFFAFDAVPPGAYALDLELADAQVLAELLDVP